MRKDYFSKCLVFSRSMCQQSKIMPIWLQFSQLKVNNDKIRMKYNMYVLLKIKYERNGNEKLD